MKRWGTQNQINSALGLSLLAGSLFCASPTRADEDNGFDMNGAIANVLGQLESPEDKPAIEVVPVAVDRSPANTVDSAEWKSSIFDRVRRQHNAFSVREHLGGK